MAEQKDPYARRRLCAHADDNGQGAHWLEPGERCPVAEAERVVRGAARKLERGQADDDADGM